MVDRFASQHNAQLPQFNSRFAWKDAEAVDTFTIDWSGEKMPTACAYSYGVKT